MNIRTIRWLAFLFVFVCSTASAEGFYLGLKAGVMEVDDSAFDEAENVGLVLGYDMTGTDAFAWAVEAEFTKSSSDGDFKVFGVNGEWDIETQAIYGVMKIGQDFYGKLKIGFLNEDVTAKAGGASFDDSDSGASAGVGLGWRASEAFALELEYTMIEEDVDFISGGINFHF